MEVQEDVDAWMDDVVINSALPEGKGTVVSIHPPMLRDTRYGKRKVCQCVIQGKDNSMINVQLFLPQQFPLIHPKSTLAKMLKYYGCTGLKELIGKEVEVVQVGDMVFNIKHSY